MATMREGVYIFILMIGLMFVIAFALNYSHTATQIDHISDITIKEKYPLSTGYMSTHPPKIVDSNDKLYYVSNEDLWAKMEVNKTYNFSYANYPNAQRGQIVAIDP